MLRQINALTKLELGDLFGLNVLRHTKDPKAKRKGGLMLIVWVFLIAVVAFYAGGLSYGLILLGAGDVVPAYLTAVSSLLIFFFGIFKAGSTLFRKNGYDILCSLPVSQTAIVISRFLRMYAEDLALTLVILLPGLGVYAWLINPGAAFYLIGAIGTLLIPLAPMAAAALVGAVTVGIASRMKHKSLVEAGLMILFVLAVMVGSARLPGTEDSLNTEILKALSDTVLEILEGVYPPAVWLGKAMVTGSPVLCLACAALFLGIFAAVALLICARFHSVCRRLFATSARHDYRMERLQESSVLATLYKRELKRYFASGIYVSNTILGPILGTVLSGAVFFLGSDKIADTLPPSMALADWMPFVLAGVFCMMTAASVSVSMEGKHWWIVKTLPLDTKSILDAKLLLNLSLMLPFYLISQLFLLSALKPGFLQSLWLLLIPLVIMVFSCVVSITVNLRLPVMEWDNEASVVKQSLSAMLGGFSGPLMVMVWVLIRLLVPEGCANVLNAVICLLLPGLTALLYRKNNRTNLLDI